VATAKDLGTAEAEVEGGGGSAAAEASGAVSEADTFVTDGTGKATASDGAEAVAGTDAPCKATASASGAGGEASAGCSKAGSVVTVKATKGSFASGSDTAAPVCTPKNGGIAKVSSPMGDCPKEARPNTAAGRVAGAAMRRAGRFASSRSKRDDRKMNPPEIASMLRGRSDSCMTSL